MTEGWLYGWADIAKYIRASVRSAQRYENQGMPVMRLPSKKIAAIPHVLDLWLIKFNKKLQELS